MTRAGTERRRQAGQPCQWQGVDAGERERWLRRWRVGPVDQGGRRAARTSELLRERGMLGWLRRWAGADWAARGGVVRSRAEGGVRAGPPRKGEGGVGRCWVDLGRVLAGLWAFWVLGFVSNFYFSPF